MKSEADLKPEQWVAMAELRKFALSRGLRELSERCEKKAKELDPRTQDEMFKKLPTEHPSTRLRYLAYQVRQAYEALV